MNIVTGVTAAGWGFAPSDILSNGMALIATLAAFVLLGIAIMYVKPLIGLIREAVKPGH